MTDTVAKKKIMIVEDNDLNMKLFTDLLHAEGYAVVSTQNGLLGYELAKAEKPDLILMDIQLPDISGLEITALIKADSTIDKIPIIAITAYAMKGDEEKIRQGGCDLYLAKPISVPHFFAAIKQLLG
jgi:two-component system cell cycle response regulator DivK